MTLHLQSAGAQTAAPANTSTPVVWDLMPLFAADAAWDSEHGAITAKVPKVRERRGSLSRDAAAKRATIHQVSARTVFSNALLSSPSAP